MLSMSNIGKAAFKMPITIIKIPLKKEGGKTSISTQPANNNHENEQQVAQVPGVPIANVHVELINGMNQVAQDQQAHQPLNNFQN